MIIAPKNQTICIINNALSVAWAAAAAAKVAQGLLTSSQTGITFPQFTDVDGQMMLSQSCELLCKRSFQCNSLGYTYDLECHLLNVF